jgi:cell division protein FtsW (lipid II flippase)
MSPEFRFAVRGAGIVLMSAAALLAATMVLMTKDWMQATGGIVGFVGCLLLVILMAGVGYAAASWARHHGGD